MKKIFISSSFKDMQSERDVIRNLVLPNVSDFLRKYGQDIAFSDLRWGISNDSLDNDVVMNKILSVCTNEIDACRPHMIVLLGDRYGTIPSESVLKKFLDTHNYISYEDAKNKSITELEILYALQKRYNMKPFSLTVCIRKSTVIDLIPSQSQEIYRGEQEDRLRIEQLKQFLITNYPNDILYYDASWDDENKQIAGLTPFANALSAHLIAKLQAGLPDVPLTIEQEQLNYDMLFLQEQSSRLVGRSHYIDDINEFLASNDQILVLRGDSGVGKTCLVAKMATIMNNWEDTFAISLFVNNGGHVHTIETILRHLVYRVSLLLDECLVLPKMHIDEFKAYAEKQITKITKNNKLVLFIDNIDSLLAPEIAQILNYLPSPTNFQIIFTTPSQSTLPHSLLLGKMYREIEVIGINDGELIAIIERFLKENGKQLDSNTIQILCKQALFHSPLYIFLAIRRLLLLSQNDFKKIDALSVDKGIDGGVALTLYLGEIISALPCDEESLAIELVDVIQDVMSFNCGDTLLSLILAGQEMLRVDDILTILNTNKFPDVHFLDVTAFINCASGLINVDNNGQIKFCHRLIKNAFIDKSSDKELAKLYKMIFKHLDKLPDHDIVRQKLYIQMAYRTNNIKATAKFLVKLYAPVAWEENSSEAQTENRIYDSFQNFFAFEKSSQGDIIRFLNQVSDYAYLQDAKFFNALAQQYLFGIYLAINKATLGNTNHELALLEPLYNQAKIILINNASEDKNYLRTTYMLAEKCGIASPEHTKTKWEFYCDFCKICLSFHKLLDESYPYLDYALCDLAISYEKIAHFELGIYNRWCETLRSITQNTEEYQMEAYEHWYKSLRYYNLAIDTVSQKVKPSGGREDLFDVLKYEYITEKYTMVFSYLVLLAQLGKQRSTELKILYDDAVDELTKCATFFEKAVKNFDSAKRSMKIAHYWYRLMRTKTILAEYCIIKVHAIPLLKSALHAAQEHNHLINNIYTLDYIRNVYYELGICEMGAIEENAYHLKQSLAICDMILPALADDLKTSMIEFKCNAAGELLKLRFSTLYPNINVESKEFIADPQQILKANKITLTKDNVMNIMLYCKECLEAIKPPLAPKIFSYNLENEKIADTMFGQIYNVACDALSYMSNLIYEDFKVGCALIDTDINKAYLIFEGMLKSGNIFCDIANLIFNRKVEKSTITISLFGSDLLVKATYNCGIIATKNQNPQLVKEMTQLVKKFTRQYAFFGCAFELFINEDNAFKRPWVRFRNDAKRTLDCIHIASLRFFVFCINQGDSMTNLYLTFTKGRELNYWYDFYQKSLSINDEGIINDYLIAGKFLCENFGKLQVRRILYHSPFYESIALEYAYKTNKIFIANAILNNGYDRYLELGTLYLLRKYDRLRFYKEITKVKRICLQRGLEALKEKYYIKQNPCRSLYGDIFCDEFIHFAKIALKEINPKDINDPRNHRDRIIPDWAK